MHMDGMKLTRRAFSPRFRTALAITITLAIGGGAGCSGFSGTTAASFLRRIEESPDPNARYDAYDKLARPNCYDSEQQKLEATRVLIAKLEDGKEPVATRAVICKTLGELRARNAREALLKATSDGEGVVRVQACLALGKVGLPEDATVLARVMTVDVLEDCRIAAIEGLGELKSTDPRILEVLVNGMEHVDPAIRLASVKALRATTGKDMGLESAPWRQWLQSQVAAASVPPVRR
jgi:HEAT repeat protein